MKTDFVRQIEMDKKVGVFALVMASVQSVNLQDDELRERLRSPLEDAAKNLAKSAADDENSGILLVETAINLSLVAANPHEGPATFTALVREIINRWPQVAQWIAPMAASFQSNLPLFQAVQIWPLSLKIRGE